MTRVRPIRQALFCLIGLASAALACTGCASPSPSPSPAPSGATDDRAEVAAGTAATAATVAARETRRARAAAARAAYDQQRWDECAKQYADLGESAERADDSFYNAACCASRGGASDRAFALLERGLERGLRGVRQLESDSDLAALRADPRWTAVLAAARANEDRYVASINGELYRMYQADQAARLGGPDIDWATVSKADAERRTRAQQLIDGGALEMADDYYHAAMLFQHGNRPEHFQLAHDLAKKAVALDPGHSSAKWLMAAAKDRHLMSTGKPQIFGTQFKRHQGGSWTMEPFDENAVTDAERAAHGVPTVVESKKRLEQMNQRLKR